MNSNSKISTSQEARKQGAAAVIFAFPEGLSLTGRSRLSQRESPSMRKNRKRRTKRGRVGYVFRRRRAEASITPAARKHNLAKLTLQEGQGAEQVAASVVKKLSEQKNNEVGAPLQLQQLKGGKALTVTVGQKRKCKEIQVKSQTVAKIKKKLRLSDRATETVCRLLREDKVSVEQGTRKFLSEVDKLLVPYYDNVKMIMEVRVPKTVVKMVRGRGGRSRRNLSWSRRL